MNQTDRLSAAEAIRTLKARYWRGVDTHDDELVRSILAEDCVLDYRGCCTDPVSGVDFLPVMNVVLKGRHRWASQAIAGFVTVHQGHQAEIEVADDGTASAIWTFSDRFFWPAGGPYRTLTGYGHYHDTYERADDGWKLKTTRITRLRVEAS